ncbi:uncharacterized protein CDAR_283071 [Caerostris darwini]|uniref:Uncharacterized protein n=2 Tax=Caerostris TaxID=172845 RepID=A0AAV4QME7_9ARAC|nr:uncharacterized protein CDAR_283071 [Caerostris darwini]
MSASETFFDTLNRLSFPGVNKFKCSDFDSIVSDPKLENLLNYLSTLNEENVLSSEELDEYSAIPLEELEYLESLTQKQDAFLENKSKDEERGKYLQNHLKIILDHNIMLQEQKEILKIHQNHLLKEKEFHAKALVDAEKLYDTYKVQEFPQAETDFVSSMLSTTALIEELQNLISEPEYSNKILPSNFKGLESYFEEERQLRKYIQDFLHKEFEITSNCDPKRFNIKLSGLSESDMQREVCFLQKVLKNSRLAEIEALSSKVKISKIVEFYKKCEEKDFPHVFKISSAQLWNKMKEENDKFDVLMEKEKLLKLCLLNTINEHVDIQCCEIGIACSEEVLRSYCKNFGKIQIPLEHLINQRARLELVLLYIDFSKKGLENIKQLIEKISCFVEKEKNAFQERKSQYEEEMQRQIPQKSEYLSDDSIFLSAYEILSDVQQMDLNFVSMRDLISKIEQLYQKKELVDKKQDKMLSILNLMEEHRKVSESHIFKGKKFSDLLKLDLDFNQRFNKLDLKVTALMNVICHFNNSRSKKQQLIERNVNQQLARKLYILALTNKESFEKWIQVIKNNCKYLADADTSQSSIMSDS